MGLFGAFKKKVAESGRPAEPTRIEAATTQDVLCAPISGTVIPMVDVPDPVFSGEVLGKGCAIWPEGDVVYAPVSGEVSVTMGHAVGIVSDDGIEALVHVGIDTVNLHGKGFTGYVKQGDHVEAGQAVLKVDRKAIVEAGYEDCVVLVVSNTASFATVELATEAGSVVAAGAPVVSVVRA